MRIAAIVLTLAALHAEEFTARVVSIADGDKITVLRNETQIRVRLHSVDAPERLSRSGAERASLP